MARRYIDQVMRAAVLEELRNGVQARELSRKYGIAESTISRWRKQENIDAGPHASAVIRSKPLRVDKKATEASEESSADRRKMINHMIGLVNNLAEDGGLKSNDIKNLSMAAKVLSEADQREQRLLEEEQARAGMPFKNGSYAGDAMDGVEDLVSSDAREVPRFPAVFFAVLDVADERDRGNDESAAEAWRKLREALGEHGIRLTEDLYKKLMVKIKSDLGNELERNGQGLS
jgi:transposase-like protein